MARLKPTLPPGCRLMMRDRIGRTVLLQEDRWRHIVARHPILDGCEMAVKATVESATECHHGQAGADVLFAKGLGPSRWLVVVIAYDRQNMGTILTAYPQRRDPGPKEGA